MRGAGQTARRDHQESTVLANDTEPSEPDSTPLPIDPRARRRIMAARKW